MERFEKDFKEWFYRAVPTVGYDIFIHRTTPFSMQWGVYIDFFVKKDLMIEVPFYWGANYWKIEISEREIEEGEDYFIAKLIYEEEDFESLNEAREAALEKAIEIYNQNT